MTEGEREFVDLLWRRVEQAAVRLGIPLTWTTTRLRSDDLLASWLEELGVLAPDEVTFLLERSEAFLCKCGVVPAPDDHSCPYKAEINDDATTLCNCCAACERECADDV